MRKKERLMTDWLWTGPSGQPEKLDLPHTWNHTDGQDGGDDYQRGSYTYEKRFARPDYAADERVFLEFDGVNASATVWLNGQELTEHHGGYSRFRVEATDALEEENLLKIVVDNSVNTTVYPQKADFTFYGGIYRELRLLIVNEKHFELLHEGGPGVKLSPEPEGDGAKLAIETWHNAPEATVKARILDAEGEKVAEGEGQTQLLHWEKARLWQGLEDPYLYTAQLELLLDGKVLDRVELKFGVRSFHVDEERGFFLNGKPYPLHGVSRHQDRRGIGNALSPEDHREDLDLIAEVGANCIRLAHYQHDQYVYDLCDAMGFVVWAEIPYISEHMPEGRENTYSQMRELIVQNHHHPSIFFWGISNEITISTKDKKDMLDNHHALHKLSKELDPSRLTVLACYAVCTPFNKVAHITDLVGWNLYLGWYIPGLFLNDWWISFFHKIYPHRPLSFSEYGCEGMPNLHSERPRRGDHSEEYQVVYHEFMLRCFERHPYMWGDFVWNMFDFAADARDQGGEPGMNHKGLMTFDRKIKKDSFYLYKAFWSKEPFVHIAGKRMADRTGERTKIKVFSNQKKLSLYHNGKLVESREIDRTTVFDLPLAADNQIRVEAGDCQDEARFKKVDRPNPSYRLKKERKKQKSNWV